MALAAASTAYGRTDLVANGPTLKNCSVVGNSVQIFFDEERLQDDAVYAARSICVRTESETSTVSPTVLKWLCGQACLPGDPSRLRPALRHGGRPLRAAGRQCQLAVLLVVWRDLAAGGGVHRASEEWHERLRLDPDLTPELRGQA